MDNKSIKNGVMMFFWVLGCAFIIAVFVTCMIAVFGLNQKSVPLEQILYDFLMALFVAGAQMLWYGAEKDNKTYIRRTILNVSVLVAGSTILMSLFGWLPPLGWPMVIYLAGFIGIYALIWLPLWRLNRKKMTEMNEKLDEYKKQQ